MVEVLRNRSSSPRTTPAQGITQQTPEPPHPNPLPFGAREFACASGKAAVSNTASVQLNDFNDPAAGGDQMRMPNIYLGGIWIRSSSWALVSSVAVNFRAAASLTMVSRPVMRSGSTDVRGKKSSRVRFAFASVIPSHSE